MEQGDQEAATGRRLLAGIVDAVVFIAAAAVLALAAQPLVGGGDRAPSGVMVVVQAMVIIAVVVVPLLLLVLLEAVTGTSPGKRLFGLRVSTPDGSPPGLSRSARRVVYRISPVALVGAVASTSTGQRPWHDEWTGTVVRGGPPRVPAPRTPAAAAAGPAPGAPASRPAPTTLRPPTSRPVTPAPRRSADPATIVRPAAVATPVPGVTHLPAGGRPFDASIDDPSLEHTIPMPRPVPPGTVAPTSTESPVTPAPPPRSTAPRSAPGAELCRCRTVSRLEGDEAIRYADSHLAVARRRADQGQLVLICPTTRATWLATEPWASAAGVTTLERQGAVPEGRSSGQG